MVKLQQFYILKFTSERLKNSKYNIEISFDEARKNKEIITINNSELLRTLFRYKKINFSQKELEEQLVSIKKIKKLENNKENQKKLAFFIEKVEKTLFVEDLVSVQFTNKSHYKTIIKKNGFYVNKTKYTPLMASAGMIRKNTALFINNSIKHQIMDILENNRNEYEPIVGAKFGAYFSLYSSSTIPVSFPKIAVIPDKTIETLRKVDFVTYRGVDLDDEVEETNRLLTLNAFDGQGLITPKLAEKWSKELELDYILSAAIIRAPFLKGLVVTFDLEQFANEIAKKYIFLDIYGKEHDIREIELIISESMFKLWASYKNTEDYIQKCHKNNLGFSIAKINPQEENSHSRTSYQFLQVLNLNDAEIALLCEPTINWFRNISGGNAENMLLYATGENQFKPKDFKKMDISVKAILLNPELARDKYIQNRFIRTIKKKEKEAFKGSILLNANYQFMIADPYYQACHAFGLEEKPLLNEFQHYSQYWINKGINKVSAIRSPIVHHSEFNILNLKNTEETKKWFAHIHSGIIFPANGIGMDCAIHGGADFDGDLICTINNPIMEKGRIPGIPIIYESKKAEKSIIDSRDDEKQMEYQLKGHNSKVGFATNISSSFYCLLEEFPIGSPEYETILKRLKIGRVIQGEIIDGVKGLEVPPFRNHWVKFKKIDESISPEEKEKWKLYNKTICSIRPSFFRFLYPHYMKKYNKEIKKYNIFCHLIFGKSFEEIYKQKDRNEKEEEIVRAYKKNSFFLDNNSVVNRISRYMRANLGLIGKYSYKSTKEFDYKELMNQKNNLNPYVCLKMKDILKEYKSFKLGMRDGRDSTYENLDIFINYLRKKCYSIISSNESECADYAISITYGGETNMVEFAWKLFPQGILNNIITNSKNKILFPVKDKNGNIEYLWNKYSLKEFNLEELYEQ